MWLRNNRNYFLTVLEIVRSKIKIPTVSMTGGGLIHGSQITPFVCVLLMGRANKLPLASFLRALTPLTKDPPSKPKGPTLKYLPSWD